MTMEDIMNSEFSGSYGSFQIYGSCPTRNANSQPEATNENLAQPQASIKATSPAVEVDQTREAVLETEAAAVVVNYDGRYVNNDYLNKRISEKKRRFWREKEELEKLQQLQDQLLQEKQHHSLEKWQQQQLRLSQRKILNEMLSLMDKGIIDGFVYGLVPKGKEPVSATSENLRGWWKEEARFDRDAPVAISRYHHPSSGPITDNINHNSLMEIHDKTLESLVSALIQQCDPPQRNYPFEKGVAPPWWPTGNEDWWGQMNLPHNMSVPPYKKPHDLKKWWKVTVLVATVKNLIADNHELIIKLVRESKSLQKRMSARDSVIWSAYIENERNIYLKLNPFTDKFSPVHGLNYQQIPCGGGTSSMGAMDHGNNEEAQEASLPAFLQHQSDSLLAQEAAGNELYNIKGKATVSDNPTFYRHRQETGLYINDTPMMERPVIPDKQIRHPNHNPLNVAEYGVETFSKEATGCTDWPSSDKTGSAAKTLMTWM